PGCSLIVPGAADGEVEERARGREMSRASERSTMSKLRKHSRASTGVSGFTMVELVMALGVVSIGLLGTLALFPLGYRGTRAATDDTQMAMIAQDYVSYYSQLVQTNANYAGSLLLTNVIYTDVVTNDAIAYNVNVSVTSSGFPQMQTTGGTNL